MITKTPAPGLTESASVAKAREDGRLRPYVVRHAVDDYRFSEKAGPGLEPEPALGLDPGDHAPPIAPADMSPASRNPEPARMSDLAQLLDSGWLITCLQESRWHILKELSTRATARKLLEIMLGMRGPRHAYVTRWLDRLSGRNALRYQEQLAALLSAQAQLRPGIGHYGFFRAEHGIGQSARRLAQAMETAAIPVSRHNISLANFESRIPFDAGNELTSPHDTILLHFNADTFLDLFHTFPLAALFPAPAHRLLGLGAARASAAMDTGARQAARGVGSHPLCRRGGGERDQKAVRVVPHPVPVEDHPQADARAQLGLPRDAFLFLTIFDSNSYVMRKNVLGTIRAFLDAFPDHGASSPMLVVKCHGRGNRDDEFEKLIELTESTDRVILIDRVFSPHEMTLIQAACDCFVSLHRAEGFGLNIAECMGKGKIVIATDFSGNTDFTRPSNSPLVPYKMIEVGRSGYMYGGGQWWAEPDHDAAVDAMRRAAANAADVRSLAARAREDIMRDYSLEAIGKIVKAAWAQTLAPFPG
jgi:glycosyltransferase involved in cell wall biosynthesis